MISTGEDTITAISTPFGTGGIGIIRISGGKAFEIIRKIFIPSREKGTTDIKTYTIRYGHIVNPKNNETIDEVLVSYFVEPSTYTRENTAEINCHGGRTVVKKILEIVVENGARIAQPGEFTMRAFMNGRLDLSQSEAVIDLINSKSTYARKASLKQLEGKLSTKIKEARDILVDVISDIEAAIDYPEYDIEEISRNKVKEKTEEAREKVETLSKTFFEGRLVSEGIEAVIIGKPNVGKSSLLNALIQKEKAIITDIPGTTRDVIEETVEIGGVAVKILDTAGLRETEDKVEKAGINRSKSVIEKADLILLVLDGSEELSIEDKRIFDMIKEKKAIIIINKSDLEQKLDINEVKKLFTDKKIIEISAKEEAGLEVIEEEIKNIIFGGEIDFDTEVIVTNVRHKTIIEETKKLLTEVSGAIKRGEPMDVVSILITETADKLGEITGETVREEVIKSIFAKFCVGK